MKEVLLVGNPNTGKTTLFNSLTKSSEHVGNWHGVTVENKKKTFFAFGEQISLVDTPGVYSLNPLSFEEEVTCKTVTENIDKKIINICDQNNIQRNLYLTLCLLEAGCDVVVVVNEIDKRPICKIDYKKLQQKLGIEVVAVNAEKMIGFDELKKALLKPKCESKKFPYDTSANFKDLARFRYQYIDQILKECSTKTDRIYGKSKLDRVLLNKWLAFPMFLLVLSTVFYLTFFSLGSLLSEVLSQALNIISNPILNLLEKGFGQTWVYDLFAEAIFGGVGTVLSFLPQVVLLFFFLSVLEDSGYLARVAFIFEDILGRIGLSGKSVYTLLMGFGCSTTAIMTARNMDDKNAKIKTAILCPYMSCSAKIPIYTVIGGAFFGAKNIFYIIGFYLLGVVVAIVISKILDKTILKSKKQSFILEFPPYRMVSMKRIWSIVSNNLKTFLVKVGSIMISMNVIIWLLSSFSFSFSYIQNEGGVSILESIGRLIAPIFSPLGFGNWAIVASLLAGLVAKEVVVSSIAMFNGIESSALKLISKSILLPTSVVFFSSQASVLAFLVFCLLYTPCVASISMLLQEIGGKWTAISVIIQLCVAYALSFVTYNLFFAIEIFGFLTVFGILMGLIIIGCSILCIFKKFKRKKACGTCKDCNKNCFL